MKSKVISKLCGFFRRNHKSNGAAKQSNSISVEVSRSSSYLYSPFDACNPLLSRPFNG
jgi:hypothetical protein